MQWILVEFQRVQQGVGVQSLGIDRAQMIAAKKQRLQCFIQIDQERKRGETVVRQI